MQVRFSWAANADGNTSGYIIHASRVSGLYDAPGFPLAKDVGNVTNSFYDIGNAEGAWFFSLSAYGPGGPSFLSLEVTDIFFVPSRARIIKTWR